MFSIRLANKDDFNSVKKLTENLLDSKKLCAWTNNKYTINNYIKTKRCYVAVFNNEVIGFVWYSVKVDNLEIIAISVSKKYRNLNIGTLLVKKIEKKTRQLGFRKIILKSLKEYNAIGFYSKLGYLVDNVGSDYIQWEFYKELKD